MSPKALIVNSNYEYEYLLKSMGYEVYKSKPYNNTYNTSILPDMDLVLFTGGEDVHPKFYNGVHTNISHTNEDRDTNELGLFKLCLKHNIKMTGVCRGIQFLNVMCGGKMHQHINSHGGTLHEVLFPATGKIVTVSSTHHQLVILPEDALPVAWTYPENMSNIYIGPNADKIEAPEHEIEAAVYPKYNAFGVQFHPEMLWCAKDGRAYYKEVLDAFVTMQLDEFIKLYAGVDHGKEGRYTEVAGG